MAPGSQASATTLAALGAPYGASGVFRVGASSHVGELLLGVWLAPLWSIRSRSRFMISARRTVLAFVLFSIWLPATPALASGPNQLANGNFEDPAGIPDTPFGWSRAMFTPGASLTWESEVARDGISSVRISSPTPNDAAWTQTVTLEPERNYLLSGWIRTQDVTHTTEITDAGANLCVWGTWQHTVGLIGTNDWTYVRMVFNSGPTGTVTIGARLGYWAGTASGTAWFDDLRVTEILASDPHPRWKILVLIYDGTDLTFADSAGVHHLVGQIDSIQVAAAAESATRFVETDIPALSSGNMLPELTVRYPGTLGRLTRIGDGWWPSPQDTAGERDPGFDSVIVIWQPTVIDQATSERLWIGTAAGLTPSMGTAQTYTTLIIEAATLYGHLNVFKHEWGHSVLDYYDAVRTAPLPTVSNHTDGNQYVHCLTGEMYVWADETDANPIANSIYNNESGFTHDYYSGTTALAIDPLRCLGITPVAWATGGPVSLPGEPQAQSPGEKVQVIQAMLRELVQAGTFRSSWSRPLEVHLDHASRALEDGDIRTATEMLSLFRRKVLSLQDKGRLPVTAADMLMALADAVMADLQAH
jgi:hypothetical protein